jgi:hypothetical protein
LEERKAALRVAHSGKKKVGKTAENLGENLVRE